VSGSPLGAVRKRFGRDARKRLNRIGPPRARSESRSSGSGWARSGGVARSAEGKPSLSSIRWSAIGRGCVKTPRAPLRAFLRCTFGARRFDPERISSTDFAESNVRELSPVFSHSLGRKRTRSTRPEFQIPRVPERRLRGCAPRAFGCAPQIFDLGRTGPVAGLSPRCSMIVA
jgi:hypothetical protein